MTLDERKVDTLKASFAAHDPLKLGLMKLGELRSVFAHMADSDFLELVNASGAGFVQYNTLLHWLCDADFDPKPAAAIPPKAESAGTEVDELKREVAQLQAKLEAALVKSPDESQEAITKSSSKSTEEQYNEAFAKVGGKTALQDCYSDYIKIGGLVRDNPAVDSPWQQDLIYQGLDSHVLMNDARGAQPFFIKVCDTLRERAMEEGLTSTVLMAPLKGLVRSNTKVSVKYAGDLTQLSDMCRATLSIQARTNSTGEDDHTLKRIYSFLKKIVKDPPPGITFTHFHDRFQKPMWGGYRDFLLILKARGVLCELQINLDSILLVKEGAGHDTYEVERLHNDLMLSAAQMNDASALSQHLKKGARPNYTTGTGFSALSYAALHDNATMAKHLLEHHCDPFNVDSTGQIPLGRAIKQDKFKVAIVIVHAMAEAVGDRSKHLVVRKEVRRSIISIWTVLHSMKSSNPSTSRAVDRNILGYPTTKQHVASELFDKFDPVFVRISGGLDSALAQAVKANLAPEVKKLIEAKAGMNRPIVVGRHRHSLLSIAAYKGHTATVQALMAQGASLQMSGTDSVDFAALKERIFKEDLASQMQSFLEVQPDSMDLSEALHLACDVEKPKMNIAQVLLQRGASSSQLDPAQLATLVKAIVHAQDEDLLSLLLMRRSKDNLHDPEAFKQCAPAVELAADQGLTKLVSLLAGAGCPLAKDASGDGTTPMHVAARNGHHQVVQVLYEHGCIVDGPGAKDRTPACEATFHGQIMTLQKLSDCGCDLSFSEGYNKNTVPPHPEWDRTLVHVAALSSESETIQFLVSMKCDINYKATCLYGQTPLHSAARFGAKDAFQRLLELKADPNVKDDEGMTPMEVMNTGLNDGISKK